MNIAFVASEVYPFSKTGGLADVAGALPKVLNELGHNVKIFTPKYGLIDEKKYGLEYQQWIGSMPVRVSGIDQKVHVHKAKLPKSDVDVYFVDFQPYFYRETIYTDDLDEAERFILFSKATLEIIQRLNWKPDVVHCNDWQTGLIPLYIKDNYNWDQLFHHTASLYTIHNIGYQGQFGKDVLDKAEIRHEYFYNFGEVEHNSAVNFMKTGISFADIINTVSETYAKEIMTKEYSAGMDYILRYRSHDLYGILNGIDYHDWDPSTDKHLPYHFSASDLSGKLKNKKFLCEQFNLPFSPDIPLIGIVSRLAIQKGFDLIARSLEYLSHLPCQWIILGSGENYYEDMFETFASYRPDKAACYIGYSNELAHLIEAGSDMFLMPSHYEPCGLNQIYSLKYGTVPIVRHTGGLADTVLDWDEYSSLGKETGNGFSFRDYNGFALTNAVERAIKYYHNKKVWHKIQMNGMSCNYSWNRSAEKYVTLYELALKKVVK
ncbi:MAG: glycogen synthase GlgA [Melioribacteraceae bacterium]|nr:glycogen synthase GlgA [Melioribacteraceae bacterium]